MKRQIRRSVFETNSSSMHSLVVSKDDRLLTKNELTDGMHLRDDGVWDIWMEDDLYFGRSPFQCLATFESKVRYAIASLCGWRSDEEKKATFERIKAIVLEAIPECKNVKLPRDNYSEKEKVIYGSVEENILGGFLENNNIDLKDFLLNKKYVVIVDGDEYCIYSKLKKSGIINKDNIKKEYPESED